MTPYVSQYHGRGAGKLLMPRPNVEWEEIRFNRRFFLTGWLLFVKEGVNLIYRLRFFFILFLVILIVTNIMTSIEFIDSNNPLNLIKDQQPVSFILQPRPQLLQPKRTAIKPRQPEITAEKPKPKPVKPKPKEEKPLNLEASLNIEKDFIRKRKKKEERKTRRVKPNMEEKKHLNLQASLNKEKDFIHNPKKKETRETRRIEPRIEEQKQVNIETPSAIHKDYVSRAKKMEVSRVHRIEPVSKNKEELNLVASLDMSEDFIQESSKVKTVRGIRNHSIDNRLEGFTDNEGIQVDIKGMDFTAVTKRENTGENISQRTIWIDDDTEGIEGVEFSIKGKSLETLKECGQQERELKTRLAKLVQEKGYIKKCMDETGKYLFYWQKDRFTVENFNVIIYPALGRDVLDRCEELNYAFQCLKKN